MLYVFALSLLSVIFMVLPLFVDLRIAGGFENVVSERIPDFKIENGRIWIEQKYVYDLPREKIFLYVDTENGLDQSKYDIDTILEEYSQILIIEGDGILSKSNGTISDLKIRDLGPNMHIDKEDLKEMKPYFYMFVFIGILIVYLFSVLGYLFTAWIFALIAILIAKAVNVKMRFKTLYKICIYARTPVTLLGIVLEVIGWSVPFFFIIGTVMTIAYIATALSVLRREAQAAEASASYWNAGGDLRYGEEKGWEDAQRYHSASDETEHFSTLPRRSHETEAYSSENQNAYSQQDHSQIRHPDLPKAYIEPENERFRAEREAEKEQRRDIRPSDAWSFHSGSGAQKRADDGSVKEEAQPQDGFDA